MNAKESYQAAQSYAKQGDMVKAVKVLQGVEHPKCEALLAKLKDTPQYRARQRRNTVIIALVVTIILITVALVIVTKQMNDASFANVCATWEAEDFYMQGCYE